MIKVTYTTNGAAALLSVTGHAGYAEKGKDIVCAACSALIETLAARFGDGMDLGQAVISNGEAFFLVSRVPGREGMYSALRGDMEFTVRGLELLAESYPRYVMLTKKFGIGIKPKDNQKSRPLTGRKESKNV